MEVYKIINCGTTYSIIQEHPYWPVFTIEYNKTYYHEDGTPCVCRFPLVEPKKIFNSLDDAKKFLKRYLKSR